METFETIAFLKNKTEVKRLWMIYRINGKLRINRYKHFQGLSEPTKLETSKDEASEVLLEFAEYIDVSTEEGRNLKSEVINKAMLMKVG